MRVRPQHASHIIAPCQSSRLSWLDLLCGKNKPECELRHHGRGDAFDLMRQVRMCNTIHTPQHCNHRTNKQTNSGSFSFFNSPPTSNFEDYLLLRSSLSTLSPSQNDEDCRPPRCPRR